MRRVIWLLALASGMVGGLVAFPLAFNEEGATWALAAFGIPVAAVLPWWRVPITSRLGAAVLGIAVAFGMLALAAGGYSS